MPRVPRMRTLIYKRTHSGDPDPQSGVFGNHDCMRTVRGRQYDAVIGVGGISHEAERNGIARKVTWIGIAPHKNGDPDRPQVTFDHFLYYGEKGPLLKDLAPALARHLYEGNVRVLLDALSPVEQMEVDRLLDRARKAPASGQLKSIFQRNTQHKSDKNLSHVCRGTLAGRGCHRQSLTAAPKPCAGQSGR